MTKSHAWFALTARSRHEKVVAENLRGKGLESFVPLYRTQRQWTDRVQSVDLPLFPGYVFCRFAYASRLPVLNTPGVTSVVSFSDVPTPVADDEIACIRTIQASGLPARPWPYVRVGQMARIEWGSLAGLEGVLIREKDALRVVVSIELLRRAVAVEIDRDMIRAVDGAEHATLAHVYLTGGGLRP
ncbi:MAG TPA: transcription termination/antitermination NusG family protein [Bryobacteraceae bacterium]|jgi:transcription antitermination factor NusG|nr:transcription termination/antitermination NusG family protein [Bryobacteraceae bacterium]